MPEGNHSTAAASAKPLFALDLRDMTTHSLQHLPTVHASARSHSCLRKLLPCNLHHKEQACSERMCRMQMRALYVVTAVCMLHYSPHRCLIRSYAAISTAGTAVCVQSPLSQLNGLVHQQQDPPQQHQHPQQPLLTSPYRGSRQQCRLSGELTLLLLYVQQPCTSHPCDR